MALFFVGLKSRRDAGTLSNLDVPIPRVRLGVRNGLLV